MLYLAALFAMALTGAQIEYQAIRVLEARGTYVAAGDWNDVGVEVATLERGSL